MAKKVHNIKPIVVDRNNMHIELGTSRLNRNLNNAQRKLDEQIMASMVPFMPLETGQFIHETQAMSAAIAGSGEVVAAAPPSGHYLYEGEVMVGERSRSAWAKKGEKKSLREDGSSIPELEHSRIGSRLLREMMRKRGKKSLLMKWVNLKTVG